MVKIGASKIQAPVRKIASLSIGSLSALLILLAVIGVAKAAEAPEHVNIGSDGYSIDRYDPVAYFTEARPVRGKPEFSAEYHGAK